MSDLARWLGKRFLSISPDEATALGRGFATSNPIIRERVDRIGATFVSGYHSAWEETSIEKLGGALDSVDAEWRGFAYEGASMALVLLDYFTLGNQDRLGSFLRGPGDAHKYMVHVGVGWALARMPVWSRRILQRLDPVLRWLAIDGLGFHEGYFHWKKWAGGKLNRKRPHGYSGRVFDQGLGRSLWFVECADIEEISARIGEFPEARRADLWSGIGLACAYAGALSRHELERLKAAADCYAAGVAQGAAFAAKARQRAGNPAGHTEIACQVLCGTSANEAASITDAALVDLCGDLDVPRYEAWRRRIAAILAEQETVKI